MTGVEERTGSVMGVDGVASMMAVEEESGTTTGVEEGAASVMGVEVSVGSVTGVKVPVDSVTGVKVRVGSVTGVEEETGDEEERVGTVVAEDVEAELPNTSLSKNSRLLPGFSCMITAKDFISSSPANAREWHSSAAAKDI